MAMHPKKAPNYLKLHFHNTGYDFLVRIWSQIKVRRAPISSAFRYNARCGGTRRRPAGSIGIIVSKFGFRLEKLEEIVPDGGCVWPFRSHLIPKGRDEREF